MFKCSFPCLLGLALFAPAPLLSSTLFTFDSLSPGTQTTFGYTVSNVTATFSSNCSFNVEPYSVLSQPPLVSGNDLVDPQNGSICSLNIVFSQPATSISIPYAFDIGSNPSGNFNYLTFSEYSGGLSGTKVASQTAYGTTLVDTGHGKYEKGVLSYSGQSINAITIQNPRTVAAFAIDNISYGNTTTVPEPAAASLAILGWAAGFALRRPALKRR